MMQVPLSQSENRMFLLDDEKFSEFMALLDAPPSTNENLPQLLTTSSPWD